MTQLAFLKANKLSNLARKIVQIIRFGSREKKVFFAAAVCLVVAIAVGAVELPVFNDYNSQIQWALRIAAGFLFIIGLVLVWQQVIPPPAVESVAKPRAIKGPLAFTVQDGELYAQLGRTNEIQELRDLILNDQVSVVTVIGESGTGKSSLLRAGIEFVLTADEGPNRREVIYWEALPDNPIEGLLNAIRQKWTGDKSPRSLEDLIINLEQDPLVILIDQTEQLIPIEHPEIFQELFEPILKLAGSHPVTWVIAFREEYLVTWTKYQIDKKISRPQSVLVKRFSVEQAKRVMSTIASESDLNLSESVMKDLLETITDEKGYVSPVDVGISLLVLSELGNTQQTVITDRIYQEAGRAEGLLASYIENHLKRCPEHTKEPLLKAFLGLCDLETNQRLAQGRTAFELSELSKLPEETIKNQLDYFSSGSVRILQSEENSGKYRLAHERIIPAIRRLTGKILAGAEQARLLLERRFRVWERDKQKRDLLTVNELKQVRPFVGQFEWGKNAVNKKEFLRVSQYFINRRLGIVAALILVVLSLSPFGISRYNDFNYRNELASLGLPNLLLEKTTRLDTFILSGASLPYGRWNLRKLDSLNISFGVSKIEDVLLPDSVKSLVLDLRPSLPTSIIGLNYPSGLKSLVLYPPNRSRNLGEIIVPDGLSTLELDLSSIIS